MSNGNTFNFGGVQQTASGDGAVNQVGNNTATTTVHKGDQVPTIPQVFGAIRESLPSIHDTADSEVADDFEEQVVMPLQTLAEMPEAEQKQPDKMEQAQALMSRMVPYAPQIGKSLAVFGSAALTALASRNPIISGILAVCNMASDEKQA